MPNEPQPTGDGLTAWLAELDRGGAALTAPQRRCWRQWNATIRQARLPRAEQERVRQALARGLWQDPDPPVTLSALAQPPQREAYGLWVLAAVDLVWMRNDEIVKAPRGRPILLRVDTYEAWRREQQANRLLTGLVDVLGWQRLTAQEGGRPGRASADREERADAVRDHD